MKKIIMLLMILGFPVMALAHMQPLPLDKVAFQLSAKDWVKTQQALLQVNISASLSNIDLVKARADIMTRLGKIAEGDWHLTAFDRSQDSSGLERLSVSAEVRVSQEKLTNVYQNAKAVSYPGATYTIAGIEFEPSLSEVELVRTQLRAELYQLVNAELDRLNKAYPTQHYTVNRLVFTEGNAQPVQRPVAKAMMAMAAASTPNPVMTQSQALIMSAIVEVASNRELIHATTPANP